jgi:pimeloyl-ACP methyl ester carboxylesterase
MWRSFAVGVWGFILGIGVLYTAPVAGVGLDPAFHQDLLGPERATGVIVWNHGRSITVEDSRSTTPPFLRTLREGGWDVLRFDRPRDGDTLTESTRRLVDQVTRLKHNGYHRIVLAGQSFGAFLALMAADASDDVDAVVATAPAAFGSFDEFYDSWRLNATRLYPLLERVKRARVMLFYFHGDDFDPGGRGERSRAILSEHGIGFAVVDQPAFLVGHWASSTGLFLRRFGACIRDFVGADALKGELVCQPVWGEAPSAELRLPDEILHPSAEAHTATPATGASAPAAAGAPSVGQSKAVRDSWYGFYPNGREVLIAIEQLHGRKLAAVYAIGPGIDKDEPAEWTRREGRIVDDDFVFEENGKSTLRFHPRADGGLKAIWVSPDGETSMEAGLRRIDPHRFSHRAEPR